MTLEASDAGGEALEAREGLRVCICCARTEVAAEEGDEDELHDREHAGVEVLLEGGHVPERRRAKAREGERR